MFRITIGSKTFEMKSVNVLIWNEFIHEQTNPTVAKIYPKGIHTAIAEGLKPYNFNIETATLKQPQHGLTQERLNKTDVLIWWGHEAHEEVSDEAVERVYQRVLNGMGLIVLHSGHFSKIFKKLMGTSCDLKWREANERQRLWVVDPAHPIVSGIGESIQLEEAEMYGEFFDIPAPDQLVFISWFEGGEVFRSGCAYHRRQGKIFYFQPGHQTHPIYYNKQIIKVIANAVNWAALPHGAAPAFGYSEPLEDIDLN